MRTLDPIPTRRFFRSVIAEFSPRGAFQNALRPACFVTTHILRDRPFFLEAVSTIADIVSLTPKPKSIHRETLSWLEGQYPVYHLSRDDLEAPNTLLNMVDCVKHSSIIFSDIGGYYSHALLHVVNNAKGRIKGVVEDTENGHLRYSHIAENIATPIVSVARSPLKNPEDFLVGQSIVFSAEALIREQGDILQGRRAVVIGYGKLGRSIAATLREKHVETLVYDQDRVKLIEALSHGFHVSEVLQRALNSAGLVFCATGNMALRHHDFRYVLSGAYVATATSSDDELETRWLEEHYARRRVADFISEYYHDGHRLYLLNHGQAVNFLHGAVVGPFIYLIQAEILTSIILLAQGQTYRAGLQENARDIRGRIADLWISEFRQDRQQPDVAT
jgi:adenosylhomocysteinase